MLAKLTEEGWIFVLLAEAEDFRNGLADVSVVLHRGPPPIPRVPEGPGVPSSWDLSRETSSQGSSILIKTTESRTQGFRTPTTSCSAANPVPGYDGETALYHSSNSHHGLRASQSTTQRLSGSTTSLCWFLVFILARYQPMLTFSSIKGY